jgi:hypothetical protein
MLKPCLSSSKPSMDIIVAVRCLNLALDHTWKTLFSQNFNSLKFHNVLAFILTEGRLLIKLIPQVLTCSQNSNGSQKFWNKERDEKELNQVHKFKPSCILLMNSHLILSLKPIYSTPFPLITYMCGRLLYGAFWESLVLPYYKWDVVKTRQAYHGLTETRQKGHWKIMLYQEGEEKNTHAWDRWTCANGKEWSRGKKEILVIGLHMVGKWVWIFYLETLKFLMHFREPRSSLYFIFVYYTYSYFFFSFFSYIYFSSFLFFFLFLIFSFSFSSFFYLLPFEL